MNNNSNNNVYNNNTSEFSSNPTPWNEDNNQSNPIIRNTNTNASSMLLTTNGSTSTIWNNNHSNSITQINDTKEQSTTFEMFPKAEEVKPRILTSGFDMLVETAAESPMAAANTDGSNVNNKYFPSSREWSPFIRYSSILEDDLAFLNSPTPHIPPRPPRTGATPDVSNQSSLPFNNQPNHMANNPLNTFYHQQQPQLMGYPPPQYINQQQNNYHFIQPDLSQSILFQQQQQLHHHQQQQQPPLQHVQSNIQSPNVSYWNNTASPGAPYSDDLLAMQSARLLSNKMALQDRLKHTTPHQPSANYSMTDVPTILNKKPKKIKPKATINIYNNSNVNNNDYASSLHLASPGLVAIANAVEGLIQNKNNIDKNNNDENDNYADDDEDDEDDNGVGFGQNPGMNTKQMDSSQSKNNKRKSIHVSGVTVNQAASLSATTKSREIVVSGGIFPTNIETLKNPISHNEGKFLGGVLPITSVTKKKVTCNCKRSRCLKLYCDCFRYEFYCDASCNCVDCANTEKFEDERAAARQACLERNSDAFKPKIIKSGVKPELAGCHCKKSACLKKYCECFTAIIPCTPKCQCVDCKNTSALYNPSSKITHPFLVNKGLQSTYRDEQPTIVHSVVAHSSHSMNYPEVESQSLSQVSMSSDLILDSSQKQESQSSLDFGFKPPKSNATSYLQIAGVKRDSSESSSSLHHRDESPHNRRRNRSYEMSFSSFSISISGLNSPAIHSRQSITSTSLAIPPLSLSKPTTTSTAHTPLQNMATSSAVGFNATTGVTPYFDGFSMGENSGVRKNI